MVPGDEEPSEPRRLVSASGEDFISPPTKKEEPQKEVGVLEVNLLSIDIFLHCRQDIVGTFGGKFYNGITAQEIRSAFLLYQVPKKLHSGVARDVFQMGSIVANEVNKKT